MIYTSAKRFLSDLEKTSKWNQERGGFWVTALFRSSPRGLLDETVVILVRDTPSILLKIPIIGGGVRTVSDLPLDPQDQDEIISQIDSLSISRENRLFAIDLIRNDSIEGLLSEAFDNGMEVTWTYDGGEETDVPLGVVRSRKQHRLEERIKNSVNFEESEARSGRIRKLLETPEVLSIFVNPKKYAQLLDELTFPARFENIVSTTHSLIVMDDVYSINSPSDDGLLVFDGMSVLMGNIMSALHRGRFEGTMLRHFLEMLKDSKYKNLEDMLYITVSWATGFSWKAFVSETGDPNSFIPESQYFSPGRKHKNLEEFKKKLRSLV